MNKVFFAGTALVLCLNLTPSFALAKNVPSQSDCCCKCCKESSESKEKSKTSSKIGSPAKAQEDVNMLNYDEKKRKEQEKSPYLREQIYNW